MLKREKKVRLYSPSVADKRRRRRRWDRPRTAPAESTITIDMKPLLTIWTPFVSENDTLTFGLKDTQWKGGRPLLLLRRLKVENFSWKLEEKFEHELLWNLVLWNTESYWPRKLAASFCISEKLKIAASHFCCRLVQSDPYVYHGPAFNLGQISCLNLQSKQKLILNIIRKVPPYILNESVIAGQNETANFHGPLTFSDSLCLTF